MKPFLFVATSNKGKLVEFDSLLSKRFSLASPVDEAFRAREAPQVKEDADSYYEHALRKALAYFHVYGVPVIADDSGLEIDALGGKPGVHSAYFGGEDVPWTARWEKVWSSLEGKPEHTWTARFRAVLCYYDGKNVPYFFEGTCEGHIITEPRGEKGFGYDPIFLCRALNRTHAEATQEEKNRVSARAEATQKFIRWIVDHPLPSR